MVKKIHAKTSNSSIWQKKKFYFWKGFSAPQCRLLLRKILTPSIIINY